VEFTPEMSIPSDGEKMAKGTAQAYAEFAQQDAALARVVPRCLRNPIDHDGATSTTISLTGRLTEKGLCDHRYHHALCDSAVMHTFDRSFCKGACDTRTASRSAMERPELCWRQDRIAICNSEQVLVTGDQVIRLRHVQRRKQGARYEFIRSIAQAWLLCG